MAWSGHMPGAFPNGHGEPSYVFSAPPPFADFFGFGPAGSGIDHHGPFHPAFLFGAPGSFGGRGRGARRGGCRRSGQGRHCGAAQAPEQPQDPEKANSAESAENAQDPPEVAPEENSEQPPPYGHGHGHGHRGWGRGRGRGRHHGAARGQFPLDPSFFIRAFANHPLAQTLRDLAEQAARAAGDTTTADGSGSDAFAPPMDLFSNESEYVLHLALPGAKKEDVGVNWDADKGELHIAGVVHRPGDEEFLRGLVEGERRVGMFERTVTLPPEGSSDAKDEVDGLGITAKMEDGVLVVVVPKVEKEWTEVRKVDIE